MDEYIIGDSKEKATPLVGTKLVNTAKADAIFFEMVQHDGYKSENGYYKESKPVGFLWYFLCKLYDGKCPNKENMPATFMNLDERYPTIFTHPEQLLTRNGATL